jgi:predicted DsbA family dithiol-disulfide isomerase
MSPSFASTSPSSPRVSTEKPKKAIAADVNAARELKIRSTPYFLLGVRGSGNALLARKAIRGARPLSEFVDTIEGLLDDAGRR